MKLYYIIQTLLTTNEISVENKVYLRKIELDLKAIDVHSIPVNRISVYTDVLGKWLCCMQLLQ